MKNVLAVNVLAQRTLILFIAIGLMIVGCTTDELRIPKPEAPGVALGAVSGAIVSGAIVGAAIGYLSGVGTSPIYSAWTTLFHERGTELREFGMYTYVLFGRDVSQITIEESLVLKRYESLLKEIGKSWQYEWLKEIAKKEEINLFCIPAKYSGSKSHPEVSIYNFDLARLYLARLGGALIAERETALRFLNKPGPFLVSTLHPISEQGSAEDYLLYSDLSETNPSAMSEVVTAYRQRIHSRPIGSVEPFQPFHLRLLSIVLDAGNNVGLVKASIFSWFPGRAAASTKEQQPEKVGGESK